MSITPKTIFIPDTLTNWPWPRVINPHYEEAKAESTAWFRTFNAFDERSLLAFEKFDGSLWSALCYPRASKDHLRAACDLLQIFFVIDEYTDVSPQHVVRGMVDPIIDALKNPHKPRPQGEVVLAEIVRQYWEFTIKLATPTAQRHFLESFICYLESLVKQAGDRDNQQDLTIESYLKHRNDNIGGLALLSVLEFQLNLPDEVINHPTIVKLSDYAGELAVLDNDIASYNREQATDNDKNNMLTVVMRELHLDLDQAVDWVVKYHADVQKKFLDCLKQVPSWSADLNWQVEEYLDGFGTWVRGNLCFHYESGRYFGDKSPEELINHRITLLPKVAPKGKKTAPRWENVSLAHIEGDSIRFD